MENNTLKKKNQPTNQPTNKYPWGWDSLSSGENIFYTENFYGML